MEILCVRLKVGFWCAREMEFVSSFCNCSSRTCLSTYCCLILELFVNVYMEISEYTTARCLLLQTLDLFFLSSGCQAVCFPPPTFAAVMKAMYSKRHRGLLSPPTDDILPLLFFVLILFTFNFIQHFKGNRVKRAKSQVTTIQLQGDDMQNKQKVIQATNNFIISHPD